MQNIAQTLAHEGYVLHSGGATGADSAFEAGCDAANGAKNIFLPWRGFGRKWGRKSTNSDICDIPNAAYDMVRKLADKHGVNLTYTAQWIKHLFARNMQQVLGANLNTPVDFVICWTPDGIETGGTRWAIWCAQENNIKVYNLGVSGDNEEFWSMFT